MQELNSPKSKLAYLFDDIDREISTLCEKDGVTIRLHEEKKRLEAGLQRAIESQGVHWEKAREIKVKVEACKSQLRLMQHEHARALKKAERFYRPQALLRFKVQKVIGLIKKRRQEVMLAEAQRRLKAIGRQLKVPELRRKTVDPDLELNLGGST